MIQSNEYFEGRVRSLGQTTGGQRFTVGVIEPGTYTFDTRTEEVMQVVFGRFTATLPDGGRRTYERGESFTVAAGVEFTVEVTEPMAYLCLYR